MQCKQSLPTSHFCVSLLINSGAKTTEKILIDCNNVHKSNQHGNILGNNCRIFILFSK